MQPNVAQYVALYNKVRTIEQRLRSTPDNQDLQQQAYDSAHELAACYNTLNEQEFVAADQIIQQEAEKEEEELRRALKALALGPYVGERCVYCRHTYASVEEIEAREVVRANEPGFKLACKVCYNEAENMKQAAGTE
jgi:head-tail adaptor